MTYEQKLIYRLHTFPKCFHSYIRDETVDYKLLLTYTNMTNWLDNGLTMDMISSDFVKALILFAIQY